MAIELLVSNSIKEYENEKMQQSIYRAVDRFMEHDFGRGTCPKALLDAIDRSFSKHEKTMVGMYKVEGISGLVMVVYDEYFSQAMRELWHYKKESLIIIKVSEFPCDSEDPIRELSEAYIKAEKRIKQRLQ